MMVIRPIAEDDLPRLLALAAEATYGLTTLPPDEGVLSRRIQRSARAFRERPEGPGGETYLFVLDDSQDGVVGICGIVSKVGGFEPFWTYRRDRLVHESQQLGVRRELDVLQLVAEHRGPTEIGSLFLSPHYRSRGAGRLLSLSRFLFMADHPELFEQRVIAEMRGVVDEQGHSPFWEAVGRHFFGMAFPDADYLSMRDKRFIGELMPQHPLYVPLLPPAAQQVIGEVHPNTRPALALLQGEGFAPNGMVDIFEAGPAMACDRDEIKLIRRSRVYEIAGLNDTVAHEAATPQLVSNRRYDVRIGLCPVRCVDDQCWLSPEQAEYLQVAAGDSCRIASLRQEAGA